jgi:hypothetical protein
MIDMEGTIMVLGKAQLSVLRRLKEEGTVKDGLHMSVHGLVREELVEYGKEGYGLSDSGRLALIATDDLTTFHRQILMQLHHVSGKAEQYTEDALKTKPEKDAYDDLLVWGMVDVDNAGIITLLDAGRKLWKVATQAHALQDKTKGGFEKANEKQREKKRERENSESIQAAADKIFEEEAEKIEDSSPPPAAPVVTPPLPRTAQIVWAAFTPKSSTLSQRSIRK